MHVLCFYLLLHLIFRLKTKPAKAKAKPQTGASPLGLFCPVGTSGLLSSRCTSLLSQPSYFSSFYLDMVKLCCCFGNDISSPTTTSSDLHAFKRIRMNLTSLYSHGIYSELATLLTLRALCHFTLTSTLYVGSSNSRSSLLQFHGGGG